MTFGIIVAAGGEGRRAGADKLWEELLGRPLIAHTLAAVSSASPDAVVVAAPPDRHAAICAIWADLGVGVPLEVVPGGSSRQQSVAAALGVMRELDVVVVHDGARPVCTPALLVAAAGMAGQCGAVSACVPVTDSVAFLEKDGALTNMDRAGLFLVQTPQAFAAHLLREAHARAQEQGWKADDDAELVRRCGHRIEPLLGASENIKVTYAVDFAVAAALLGKRGAVPTRDDGGLSVKQGGKGKGIPAIGRDSGAVGRGRTDSTKKREA